MKNDLNPRLRQSQKFLIFIITGFSLLLLFLIFRYWYADILYARAKNLNRSQYPTQAAELLKKAIDLSPYEALFRQELSQSYTLLELPEKAIAESQRALAISPANVNLKRAEFTMYIRLGTEDPKYLEAAIKTLKEAIQMAPTDARLYYDLGLTYVRVGENKTASDYLLKAIKMKDNYKEARLALAYIYSNNKEYSEAAEQLNYILTKIDPNDEVVKEALEEIR